MANRQFAAPIAILGIIAAFFLLHTTRKMDNNCQQTLDALNIPRSSSQIVLVQAALNESTAKITFCQKQENQWHQHIRPFMGVVGQAGIAPMGKKKEGDLKTPAGLYSLGPAFGTEPLAVKMDFKYITASDKFIDDSQSPDYNSWVHGKTKAKTYEMMLIPVYRKGLIVNYNMSPIIPGAGSAIFIHLWGSTKKPTRGCIAMNDHHLMQLLHWLDKSQDPQVYMGITTEPRP